MSDNYKQGSVEFGEPATYNGRKRIDVSVRREDYKFSHTVLHLVKEKPGRYGWIAVMPRKTVAVGRSWSTVPERKLSYPISLKETKVRVAKLIMAAGNDEQLETLRTATEVPEWVMTEAR